MDGCRRADGEFSRRIHDAVERASLDVQSGSSDEEEEEEVEEEKDEYEDSSNVSSLCPLPVPPPNPEPKTIPTVSNPNSVYRVGPARSGLKYLSREILYFVSYACTVNPLVVICSYFFSSVNFLLVRHRPGWGTSERPSLGKCSHHLMPPQLEVQALSLPARKASSPTGLHSPSLGLGWTSTTGSASPVPSTSHAMTWISTLGWEAGSEKCSGQWWIMFKGIY